MLARIANEEAHLAVILDLDHATNERLFAERERAPGIGVNQSFFGVPCCRIGNAAFTHSHPLGSRFNGPDRSVWYAAFEGKTLQADVAFHNTLRLADIGLFEDEVMFDEYISGFSGEFHDLRARAAFRDFPDADSHVASQRLAERLLEAGSLRIVYLSDRVRIGTCPACFRPALVDSVCRGNRSVPLERYYEAPYRLN